MVRTENDPKMRIKYDVCARSLGLSLIVGSLLLSACGDSTTGPEPEPVDHAENVVGVQLVLSARTVATYDGPSGTWSDEFEVEVGEFTAHIDVRFVDANGVAVELGDDFYLEVESEDESIATIFQDDPGGFGIHIEGIAEGETELEFRLMHGALGTGHPDFITAGLEVHVHAHDDGDDDDAGGVEGVQLVLHTDTVAIYDGDTRMWSDEFEIDVGETSDHIDVRFVDHDGDAVELGDDYYLEVESEDENIATFIQDDPGGFAIHIRGVAEGETELEFRLMHGAVGTGHPDFITAGLDVHVHAHDDGDDDDAGVVEGVQLVSGTDTIAIYDGDTEMWSDEFEIDVGETSDHIDVRFVDHDGDVVELGDDYYLEVESENDSIATFIQDDPGGFGIHIRGVAAGETGMVFRLMHGTVGAGHADFETEPLHVDAHAHDGDDDDDTSGVEGVQLVLRTDTIAIYDGDTETWSDTVEVNVGVGPHIDVQFVDHDGDVVELGDDYYLELESQDESIARFIQDDPGGFGIHIRGIAAGEETGMVFRLMHGAVGAGHADFETEPLHVRVRTN